MSSNTDKRPTQEKVFGDFEGDNWLNRNLIALESKSKHDDPVFQYMSSHSSEFANKKILEIGCSMGYRLKWIQDDLKSEVYGFDPSKLAIEHGRNSCGFPPEKFFSVQDLESYWKESQLIKRFGESHFDCIIFGFCLYLCSPHLLSTIVAQVDLALKENGQIIIFDFDSEPQRNPYGHLPHAGLYAYKQRWDKLFTGLPFFSVVEKSVKTHDPQKTKPGDPKEQTSLTVLRKIALDCAYPEYK